jgi:hypothetical protein
MTWLCPALIALFVLLSAPLSAQERVKVYGVGGLVMYQLQNVGHSIAEVQRLANEREQNILKLRAALERCGSCPERSQIAAELKYWTDVDDLISGLEHTELASRGLGQYKSFRHMFRDLKEKANSPEFWERYHAQKQKEHVQAWAKATVRSICDRQALRKAASVGPEERKARRWVQQVPYNGEKYFLDADAYKACELGSAGNASTLAAQHDTAEQFCAKFWEPTNEYYRAKGILLSASENQRFKEECMRLNSPIEAEKQISRVNNGAFLREDGMKTWILLRCGKVAGGSAECRRKTVEAPALVAEQDRARAYCAREFTPSGKGGAFFEYFDCLRSRDPVLVMIQEMQAWPAPFVPNRQ